MNSSNLQKLFTKAYEDFFSKNNLIVSCPHIINRGDITCCEGIKVKIAQKVPTKVYIGINIRKDKEIQLKTITRFVNAKQEFEEKNIETEASKEINEKMKDIIQKKLSEYGCTQGFDMTVISENEKGTGIASYSIRALLISFVLHILGKKIVGEQLDDYAAFTKSKEFKGIYTTAKELMEAIWGISKEEINTTTIFTATVHKGNIGIGLENKDYLELNYPKTLQIENNICLEHLDLDSKKLIEYSILNFGGFFHEFYNKETYRHEQEDYDNILKEYGMYQKRTTAHIDMMNILYLKVFTSAKEALLNPTNDNLANDFFDNINRVGTYQTFIEKDMGLHKEIIAIFKKNKTFKDEKIGLIPISSAKPGGTFLCITKAEKSRETLKKMINEIHNNGHTTVNFQYLSWEDGISEDHLKIEQYISKGQFSSYIQEGNLLLEYGSGSDFGKKVIGNHRELREKAENSIVFDDIEKKIYIDNKITNHKEILSQSGTVEIIKVLFENMGSYVNNTKLPPSSYSKNKNDMVGKIIGPLQELVQKKFNEKLDLECTGSLVDFDLKLTPNKVHIYLLKKIQ